MDAPSSCRRRLVAARLAGDEPPDVDLVMVHDARMAGDLGGEVPLVLAGHVHSPREDTIEVTRLLVEGSTGGAGLRALRGVQPEPLTCMILYFDPETNRLVESDEGDGG